MLYQDRAYDTFCTKDILYVITIKEVIMSHNTEKKGKIEQLRVNGRNYDAVVRQLVEKYNASEGWAVVRVVPSILSLDVYLERNAEQGKGNTATKAVEPKLEVKVDTNVSPKLSPKVDVEVVDEKEKQTVAKKAATTNKTATKK